MNYSEAAIMSNTNEKCTICGNITNNQHYKIQEKMFSLNDEEFDYLLCGKCGTLQLNTVIDNMSDYYPKAYNCFDVDSKLGLAAQLRHYIISNMILLTNTKVKDKEFDYLTCLLNLNISKTSKILDLGCGSGKWLNKLSIIGFRNLTGVDRFNQREIDTNQKWKFIQGQIFDVKDRFDVITMNHSFEHMEKPFDVLKKVEELLVSNGYCIIRIPVMDKYAWRKYNTNWVQIDAPRHLFLYTERAMAYIGKRVGLKLEKVVFDSDDFQFWGSEVYLKKNMNLNSAIRMKDSLISAKKLKDYQKHAEKLNEEKDGDQAIFIFRKIG
jgi:ubiquinone/menaquinone biosynthesis C-methylase UbiE